MTGAIKLLAVLLLAVVAVGARFALRSLELQPSTPTLFTSL